MTPKIIDRLECLADRYRELSILMSNPETVNNQNQFIEYSKEFSDLSETVSLFDQYQKLVKDIVEIQGLIESEDVELSNLAQEEYLELIVRRDEVEKNLRKVLVPTDPLDERAAFIEIRAGTGGDEAALFAADLSRMYLRYAEKTGWDVQIINESVAELGGFKEVVLKISGTRVYGSLRFESGAHRVQRVPVTESQGRIHTSACTVVVLPESDPLVSETIDPKMLRIDTFRSSGAGGQHVNKTDSAIRITHIPSGFVVECQDERSQHKNRARALALLQARLDDAARSAHEAEKASERKILVGSGDRSERIRTYNFPQGRITDHRLNLTLYRLNDFLDGQCQLLIEPLITEYRSLQFGEIDF